MTITLIILKYTVKNPVENSIVSNVGEINDELISVLNDNTDLVLFKNILKLPLKILIHQRNLGSR